MPYKEKEKTGTDIKKILLIAGIALTAIILILASFMIYKGYTDGKKAKETAKLDAMPRIVVPKGHFAPVSFGEAEMQKNIRAAKLTPGVDLYTDKASTKQMLEEEVDKLIKDIKSLSFNSIIIDTKCGDSVIFDSSKLQKTPVDLLSIVLAKAKENDMTVSVVYNLTGVKNAEGVMIDSHLSTKNRTLMADAMEELAVKYELESILLDNYYVKRNGSSYEEYIADGSMGKYEDWLVFATNMAIYDIREQTKLAKATLPVGLAISNVWANANKTEGGSNTNAKFQALKDGYADTKKLVDKSIIDFVNVDIKTSIDNKDESFKTIVSYWGALCKATNLPMYVTHSGESVANTKLVGWNGIDELAGQLIKAKTSGNYYGSYFSGIKQLVSDKSGSTAYLKKYLAGEIKDNEVSQGLDIITPKKQSTVTYEESIQFKMKFDPNADVTLNGKKITPSERGGASEWVNLKIGQNVITLSHKGRTTTYNVERKIIILKQVSPTKTMKVPGSSKIEVNALAYKGAKVTAKLNGVTVTLKQGGGGDNVNTESAYVNYQGEIAVPKSTAKNVSIGTISFYGSYSGYSATKPGSAITVEKLPDEVDPDKATGLPFQHAVVTNMYANTYPFKTTGAYPQAILYQLPYGTQDIVESISGDYVNLRSGKTVNKSDVQLTEMNFVGNNSISQLKVGVEGNDTVIRAAMNWKSPMSLSLSPYTSKPLGRQDYNFTANTVTILLDYTTTINAKNVSGDMSSSPIFSGISYKRVFNSERKIYQYQITLPMRQTGRYYGCHAEWENNTLVLRFNHPAQSGSLSGVKIAVDPGHGGSQTGNVAGRDSVEKVLNLEHGLILADSLRALGADVFMTRTDDSNPSLSERVRMAERNGCDLFISVHQNSAGSNPAPYGVQTYYNAPFSQPLAEIVEESLKGVVPSSKWNYWNGSESSYNFVVTRERQFPSILVECAFLSNVEDEARAMDPSQQQMLMDALAQGVANYYSAYN